MIINFGSPYTWDFFLLREHVDAIEDLLAKEAVQIRTEIEKESAKIKDPQDRDEFNVVYGEDIWKLEDEFPQMHRAANLIAIISRVETKLNSLCDHAATKAGINLQVQDFNGRGIERAKIFLSKVLHVKDPWTTSSWNVIRLASGIRNDLVHNEGFIQKEDLKQYIQHSQHLSLNTATGKIHIKKTYLRHLLEEVIKVFTAVSKSLKLPYDDEE